MKISEQENRFVDEKGHTLNVKKIGDTVFFECLLCGDAQEDILVEKQTCLRCGCSFYAQSEKLPKTCPNKACRSPYWNKPRTKGLTSMTRQ